MVVNYVEGAHGNGTDEKSEPSFLLLSHRELLLYERPKLTDPKLIMVDWDWSPVRSQTYANEPRLPGLSYACAATATL